MDPASVGVVVVNWNGFADTRACLDSVVAAVPGPARVVVVDNASTDGSLQALERWRVHRAASGEAPPVSLLASARNRGFAGANNLGIAYLAADPAIVRFLLLNNDATVDAGFFTQVARALQAAPDAGIVGPTIYLAGRPGEVWYAGGYFVPLRSLVVHRRTLPPQPGPVATEFVTGCAMVVSRSAWETLGPLPECYFMYLEDAEYCYRARELGLAVLYVPQAVAYHAVGATVRGSIASPQVEYWKTRNRALFVRRNLRGWARWGALAYLVVTKPGRALWAILRGRPAVGWAVLHGTVEGLLSKHGNRVARQPPAVQNPRDSVLVHE